MEHTAAVIASGADGVISGSIFTKTYERDIMNPENALLEIAKLAGEIKESCIEGYGMRRKEIV